MRIYSTRLRLLRKPHDFLKFDESRISKRLTHWLSKPLTFTSSFHRQETDYPEVPLSIVMEPSSRPWRISSRRSLTS